MEKYKLLAGETNEMSNKKLFIGCFIARGVYNADTNKHVSFIQGGGHGGSHLHLVHELISALVENREPFPNARQSANITSVGILAHQSVIKGGETIALPDFTFNNVKEENEKAKGVTYSYVFC